MADYVGTTNGISIGAGSSVFITDGTGSTIQTPLIWSRSDSISTPSGTSVQIKKEGISPRLYFSFVKSKLTTSEIKRLKIRTQNLKALMDNAKEANQTVLYEDSLRLMAIALREQEAAAAGFAKYVKKADIDRFRSKVSLPIGFCKVENFVRPIPAKAQRVLSSARKKELFDEYWVLFTDPKNNSIGKTEAEKAAARDPILFGKYMYDEERYYYLTDWVDEFCDLTLDKFIDELNKEKTAEVYDVSKVDDIDEDTADMIKKEAARKWKMFHGPLTLTASGESGVKKKSWWKFW